MVESEQYPEGMEGQAADGSDPLSHEAVVVLYVTDHVSVGVVDGDELVHGAAGGVRVRVRVREGRKTVSKTALKHLICHCGLHNGPAVCEGGGLKDFWGSHQANRLA